MLYSGTFFKLVSSDSLVDAIPYAEFESTGYSEEVAGKDELDFALVRLDGARMHNRLVGQKETTILAEVTYMCLPRSPIPSLEAPC